MNIVFYLAVIVGLAGVAIILYPTVSEAIRDIGGDLKEYYDEHEHKESEEEDWHE